MTNPADPVPQRDPSDPNNTGDDTDVDTEELDAPGPDSNDTTEPTD